MTFVTFVERAKAAIPAKKATWLAIDQASISPTLWVHPKSSVGPATVVHGIRGAFDEAQVC